MWLHFALLFKLLKNGSTFLLTVLRDQATDLVMHNAAVLQLPNLVLLHINSEGNFTPKQEVLIRIGVYMDVVQNKDRHKEPFSIGI